MIAIAKNLVENLLIQAGIPKAGIYHEESAFDRVKAMPFAVILAGDEKFEEKKRRVTKFTGQEGRRFMRHQRYERTSPLEITVMHKTEDDVDKVLTAVLETVPDGVDDGKGNYTPIRPAGIQWMTGQRDRAGAVLILHFIGGIYQDKDMAVVESVVINVKGE
ncbi:hypothetical protein [Pelotomaculum propionicicum]|uniref:Uncharacterized protein n=1 Tax=Pelotomaculum propionicicum TaxID=258475 RepID=A0A4Y7RJH2_9FIRM|nr:hypothetical protein [Pelotomaculum propionicicum]TEB09144.1 hypothetical protein Pmgp_03365 [Pelotomaculum propionicicum]